jgi:hypothetical protein
MRDTSSPTVFSCCSNHEILELIREPLTYLGDVLQVNNKHLLITIRDALLYFELSTDWTKEHIADTYQLRHVLQTFPPLGLRTVVLVPDVHVGHPIGHIATCGANKVRQKVSDPV